MFGVRELSFLYLEKKEHCFGPFYVEFIFEKKLFVEAIPLLVIGIICYFC